MNKIKKCLKSYVQIYLTENPLECNLADFLKSGLEVILNGVFIRNRPRDSGDLFDITDQVSC